MPTDVQPIASVSVSVNSHDRTATVALFDTGASNFITEAMALRLDPARSLFSPTTTEIELGDKSTFLSKFTMQLYISLEPLDNKQQPTTIQLTAIVAPTLPFDLIIGNTTIHTWNLYPWLQHANHMQFQRAATPLARMLNKTARQQRPTTKSVASSDAASASVTSAILQADFRRIDGLDYIDPDIDDCPPDSFPRDIIDNLSDTDSIGEIDYNYLDDPTEAPDYGHYTESSHPLTRENLLLLAKRHPAKPKDNHVDGESMLDDITIIDPTADHDPPIPYSDIIPDAANWRPPKRHVGPGGGYHTYDPPRI